MLVRIKNPLVHMQNAEFYVEGTLRQLDEHGEGLVTEEEAVALCDYPTSIWKRLPKSEEAIAVAKDILILTEGNKELEEAAVPMDQTVPMAIEEPVAISPITVEYPEVPGEGQNWPDPKEDMSIEYLHKMCEAYEVQYHHAMKQKKLVSLLMYAMYDK